MLGGRSFQLARIFGIRIGADTSWFIALFVLILLHAYRESQANSAGTAGPTATPPVA